MPSFGEKLKHEREKRKISLEQISASTKIGTRMLQALEENKFNQLPGGIFNKGFVRAYSRCLGLDEDQIVAEYLQASGDAPPVSTEITPRSPGAREDEENLSRLESISDAQPRQLPWGLLAAILVLLALLAVFWSRKREHARQSVHPAASTSATPTPAARPSGSVSNSVAGNDSAQSAANAPGEFTVVVHAREESWILVTADGKTVPSEVLTAGSERVLHGRQKIIVKAGNAGGLDFRFNGKKLDAGGSLGEVKTVTFGPDGMVLAPAAPSSTP